MNGIVRFVRACTSTGAYVSRFKKKKKKKNALMEARRLISSYQMLCSETMCSLIEINTKTASSKAAKYQIHVA